MMDLTIKKLDLNPRQLRLKNMIDTGHIPVVIDATGIWSKNESEIPFHWGDIVAIEYGYTVRFYDRLADDTSWYRVYTGPGKIKLENRVMVKGDSTAED